MLSGYYEGDATAALIAQDPIIDDPDRAPSARIVRLSRRLRYAFDAMLEPQGLTHVQCGLLMRLEIQDGLVQAELGRRMAIEPATLTGIVQRLEREGWVRRSCDPDNRRLQRVRLTEKARDVLPALHELQTRHRARAIAGLSSEELTTLEDLLERIEVNVRS
ncbi:MAG: MarR family winged helix-turn-helix transcriptional regulator [Dehalococcoidia bacterium]